MTKLVQKSFPFLLLLFGSGILGMSLVAANKATTGDTTRLLGQKMYMGRTILPDHVLYPFVMIGDRIRLTTASNEEQILLSVEYADRRYRYAAELLHKNQEPLAFTTITKSQKYLFHASNQLLSEPRAVDAQTVVAVRNALDHSIYRLEQLKSQVSNENAAAIDQLILESSILLQNVSNLVE